MIFLDNALANFSTIRKLKDDFQVPSYIASTLKHESTGLTLWDSFKRHPKFNHKERVVCVVHGSERFRLVSAIFKQNMYSGIFDQLDPLWTPINLFETDPEKLKRYSMMNPRDVYQADLRAGSCLYIPSYYWY